MKTKLPMIRPISAGILFCLSTASLAQQTIPGALPGPGIGASSSTTTGASPQTSSTAANPTGDTGVQARAWSIHPRVTLTETLTDNVNISRTANSKQGDLITQLAPGIRIEAKTARLKGYFDYALRGQFYAQTDYSRSQNSLNTFGTFEAVDNWLFLDFSGVIAQQAISALGTQSASNTSINNNSTETATYRLSPYIRGQLAGLVDYSLRYNLSTTRSDANFVSNLDLSQWVGQLRGSTPFQNLKWTIDGNQQSADYSNGRKTDAETLRAMLTYSVLPQFRVSMSGGVESNNYASLNQETNTTYGYGFDWNPTERTQFSVFKEKRFFGDGHNIRFNHRFPRSSIQFTDTRDVSVLPNQFASTGMGNMYDIYYQMLANTEPYASMVDPASKDSAVASAVSTLLAKSGIPPNAQATSSFLTSRATVQRRQQLALAMIGVRNSITLMANRNESQSVLAASSLADDFSRFSSIRQQGLSLNIAHRLSELSNLNFLASRQESTGSTNSNSNLKTTTTTLQVNVSTKLGAKTTGSVSARRTEFDSTTNPYTENAVIGTVSYIY